MYYLRITLLAAAVATFSLTSALPAFASELMGTDVTVVEAGTSDMSEDSIQDVRELQEAFGSRESKGCRVSAVGKEEYISQGPGVQKEEKEEAPALRKTSLGRFTITGYCGCEQYSSGHGLAYSDTVPTPNHIIFADLNYFPLGTKLRIDGTVYMVEDKGSFANDNIFDIYYGSHQKTPAEDTYTAGVFLV